MRLHHKVPMRLHQKVRQTGFGAIVLTLRSPPRATRPPLPPLPGLPLALALALVEAPDMLQRDPPFTEALSSLLPIPRLLPGLEGEMLRERRAEGDLLREGLPPFLPACEPAMLLKDTGELRLPLGESWVPVDGPAPSPVVSNDPSDRTDPYRKSV